MAKESGLIPKELITFLNFRVNQEELSSRLYYAMHEWCDNKGYFGAAKLLKDWSNEEMDHASWARKFLESYGYLPEVQKIDKVPTEFESFKDVFKKAYDHEVEITDQCNELAQKVVETKCYCAMPLALKYLEEQTDEMEKTTNWLDRIALVDGDPREIMLIDREMGQVYGGPVAIEG